MSSAFLLKSRPSLRQSGCANGIRRMQMGPRPRRLSAGCSPRKRKMRLPQRRAGSVRGSLARPMNESHPRYLLSLAGLLAWAAAVLPVAYQAWEARELSGRTAWVLGAGLVFLLLFVTSGLKVSRNVQRALVGAQSLLPVLAAGRAGLGSPPCSESSSQCSHPTSYLRGGCGLGGPANGALYSALPLASPGWGARVSGLRVRGIPALRAREPYRRAERGVCTSGPRSSTVPSACASERAARSSRIASAADRLRFSSIVTMRGLGRRCRPPKVEPRS